MTVLLDMYQLGFIHFMVPISGHAWSQISVIGVIIIGLIPQSADFPLCGIYKNSIAHLAVFPLCVTV